MAIQKLDYYSLEKCTDLGKWVASRKIAISAFDITMNTDRRGTSQFVAVECEGYAKADQYEMQLEIKPTLFHINFYMKVGAQRQRFYQISSKHRHRSGKDYTDSCCGGTIVKETGYEKRTAHACKDRVGRISHNQLTHHALDHFMDAVQSFLNFSFPSPSHRIKMTAQLGGWE